MLPQRQVARVDPPTTARFTRDYESTATPVVLRGLVTGWPATQRWSLQRLAEEHGGLAVTAAQLRGGAVVMSDRRGLAHEATTLGAFLDELREGASDRYVMTPHAGLPARLADDAPEPEYCHSATWRDGNLWIGAADTRSGLHFDLADNLHAVVLGRKRFALAAPRQSASLYPNGPLHGVPNGARADLLDPDLTRHPRLRGVVPLVADLEPGDAIYIPRLWWHQARTLAPCASVNFWWASGLLRTVAVAGHWFKRARGVSL